MENVTRQNEIIGKRLKELREERELSQEKLAKELNISREALANFETRRDIPEDRLQDIVNYFNVSIDYLLGKTNVKSKNSEIQLIGKYTGLTDKSIEVLNILFKFSPNVIDTINFLLEQEEFLPVSEYSASAENEKKAGENFDKMNEYWETIHFPVLSKITNFYNIEMPKETLVITNNGIKTKKDFKNKYEMMKETKAKISAQNLINNGLLDEITYQLKKSKEHRNNKEIQKQEKNQMKKYIEKYNEYGKIKREVD